MRVGLAGYGLAGRVFHAPFIRATDGLELTAVWTTREVEDAERVQSFDALLERSELVVIATPNQTHSPLATQALERGLHVIVDKPLALNAQDAERLANSADRRLTVYQNRRWDGDFLTLREKLPELGTIVRFESRFERFRPDPRVEGWKADPAEGGALLDFGAHLVDQALLLFGPVEHVYAEVRAVRPGSPTDDDDFLALRHASGVISHLAMGHAAPLVGPRFRVSGLKGGWAVDGVDPQEPQLRAGMKPTDPGYGVDPERGDLLPGDYAAFYRQALAWARDGAPPPVDPQDAVAALRILDAAARP